MLPGCLLGVYDLFRGIPRIVDFCADAAAAEMTRAKDALKRVARGTLIVGDRRYGAAAFFEELRQNGLWGLFRRNRRLGLRRVGEKPLRKRRTGGGRIVEGRVEAGSGVSAPSQRLRRIRFPRGSTAYELLTNVLEPERLSAEEALILYGCRWSIEGFFKSGKQILGLAEDQTGKAEGVEKHLRLVVIVYSLLVQVVKGWESMERARRVRRKKDLDPLSLRKAREVAREIVFEGLLDFLEESADPKEVVRKLRELARAA